MLRHKEDNEDDNRCIKVRCMLQRKEFLSAANADHSSFRENLDFSPKHVRWSAMGGSNGNRGSIASQIGKL